MDFTEVEKEEQQELSEIPFKADNNIFIITTSFGSSLC